MYEGVMDDIRTCVRLGVPKRIPVFALSEEFDVKWYGRYTYEETCQDGDKMAETWIAATEAFDYDWAWLQVDDCFEFEPLGVGCFGQDNILRATKGYLPPSRETLKGLKVPNPQRTAGCRKSSRRSSLSAGGSGTGLASAAPTRPRSPRPACFSD